MVLGQLDIHMNFWTLPHTKYKINFRRLADLIIKVKFVEETEDTLVALE